MKLNEPIGNSIWGAFFVRMTLGGYLALSGLAKIQNMSAFIDEVQRSHMFSAHMGMFYAIGIPYLQLFAGGLLMLGIWTTLAAILSSLIVASFVASLGIFPTNNRLMVNKDLILLAASVSLLYSGAGALSVDRFRKSG